MLMNGVSIDYSAVQSMGRVEEERIQLSTPV